jgi:hypothetical protein
MTLVNQVSGIQRYFSIAKFKYDIQIKKRVGPKIAHLSNQSQVSFAVSLPVID